MKTFTDSFGSSFDAIPTASDRREADGALLARLGRVLRSIAEFPRRRAAIHELSTLSDRELADIGLSRADVPHVFEADFATRHETGASI